MTILTNFPPGLSMRREKLHQSRQYYHTSDRVKTQIDAIGKWAADQGLHVTRKQPAKDGKVGYNATFIIQLSIENWAREITPRTIYHLDGDHVRRYLLEYYNLLYIDERQQTSVQLAPGNFDSMRLIIKALLRSGIALHYSGEEQRNFVQIISLCLSRMADRVGVPPLPLY